MDYRRDQIDNILPKHSKDVRAMPDLRRSVLRDGDKKAILRNHPIFGEIRPDLLDQLTAHAVRRMARIGATIFARGDPGTCLFAICSGTVKISSPSPSGKGAIFNLISDGTIFGEIALLDGLPRTADATAVTDCDLMSVERRDFLPLLRHEPELARRLVEILCRRLRQTTEQVEDLMFLDLPGRLAKTLLQLAQKSKATPRGPRVPLTQAEIGQTIGFSRESTNKQLRAWQNRKLVRLERAGIVLLQMDTLAGIAAAAD